MASRALLLKTNLRLGHGKVEVQFETTLPEVYRFRKQVERFASSFPFAEENSNLDFVAAFRESVDLGLEHTDVHKWVLKAITADINRVGDALMKSVDRHLRRRRQKKRERSEIEIFRLRKFSHRLAASKVLKGDPELISHFLSK